MAKNSFSKNKKGFSYKGDIQECIKNAEAKITKLERETAYILRRWQEEERRKKAHFNAIQTAKDFIRVATDHLNKKAAEAEAAEVAG